MRQSFIEPFNEVHMLNLRGGSSCEVYLDDKKLLEKVESTEVMESKILSHVNTHTSL